MVTMDIIKSENIDSLGIAGAYNRIISDCAPVGKILSVGDSAVDHAILNMPYFRSNKDKIDAQGINLSESQCGTYNHFTIHHGNANRMPQHEDESFDCVISFMMCEHNPEFWLALAEMRRVLKKGGALIVGVPGYHTSAQIPAVPQCDDNYPMSLTYGCHGDPDCYRFSPHFFKYVVFKDFSKQVLFDVLLPPRLIGLGYK